MTPARAAAFDERAHVWVAERERLDALNADFEDALLRAADAGSGARVLDVGCGTGTTTMNIASSIGPEGSVVALDSSPVMLEAARERVGGFDRVFLELGDAQAHPFGSAVFDLVVSRFALMLLSDPARGFANLRRALRPGGRLAATVWQERSRNAWMALPLSAISEHIDLPEGANGPGAFSLADPDHVSSLLAEAGFESIEIAGIESQAWIGRDVDDVIAFFRADMGHRLESVLAPAAISAVEGSLRRRLSTYVTQDGVRIPCAAWLVTARRP